MNIDKLISDIQLYELLAPQTATTTILYFCTCDSRQSALICLRSKIFNKYTDFKQKIYALFVVASENIDAILFLQFITDYLGHLMLFMLHCAVQKKKKNQQKQLNALIKIHVHPLRTYVCLCVVRHHEMCRNVAKCCSKNS